MRKFCLLSATVMAGLAPIGANLGLSSYVTPAKAGAQRLSRTQDLERLVSRLRGDDSAIGRLPEQVSAYGAPAVTRMAIPVDSD